MQYLKTQLEVMKKQMSHIKHSLTQLEVKIGQDMDPFYKIQIVKEPHST